MLHFACSVSCQLLRCQAGNELENPGQVEAGYVECLVSFVGGSGNCIAYMFGPSLFCRWRQEQYPLMHCCSANWDSVQKSGTKRI